MESKAVGSGGSGKVGVQLMEGLRCCRGVVINHDPIGGSMVWRGMA